MELHTIIDTTSGGPVTICEQRLPDLLESAANELCAYIDAENARIKGDTHGRTDSEPDLADHQTCYELALQAKRLREGAVSDKA